jgi:hypothetical protein
VIKLSKARDAAVIAGAITTGLAATYLMLDDLLTSPPWSKPTIEPETVMIGNNFDLYSVGSDFNGGSKSTYLRPATEEEHQSSLAAEEIDDGPGVFGVDQDGNHVLPGTPEWARALAPTHTARLSYYRVA